jgi:hypothetical protein
VNGVGSRFEIKDIAEPSAAPDGPAITALRETAASVAGPLVS